MTSRVEPGERTVNDSRRVGDVGARRRRTSREQPQVSGRSAPLADLVPLGGHDPALAHVAHHELGGGQGLLLDAEDAQEVREHRPVAAHHRRLAGRRVCGDCGRLVQVALGQSSNGTCESCGGPLLQRDDDRVETVGRRMEVYERETAPLVGHYRTKGLLREVVGTGSRDDVFQRITGKLQ